MLYLYAPARETEERGAVIERLYGNYGQTMYNTAFAILHNEQDAEDAVQSAFLRVIENIAKISGMSAENQKCYIFIIVRNVSIDMRRKAVRRKETEFNESLEYISGSSEYERLRQMCELCEVKAALSGLGPAYHDVLYMKFFLEQSVPEISRKLGVKPQTVRQRIYRAKRKLRKYWI